jgi:hypothetical protein
MISVMSKRNTALPKKKLDYPEVTEGSRLAAEIRKRASRLSTAERRSHFEQAMAMIYGAAPSPKTTRS